MAMTSTFEADFTLFRAQVSIAQTALQGFEKDTEQVAASLTKMEQSISGQAIVQAATLAAEAVERLGGVSKLTYGELQRLGSTAQEAVDKLNALGQKVPANIQDLADRARGAAEEMLRMKDAATENEQATSGWNSAVSVLAGTFGALSLQRIIDEAISFGKAAIDMGDKLEKLHGQTGVSVEALQKFQLAGEAAGVGLDTIAKSMTTLQKNIGEGTPATVKALQDLGIQIEDVRNIPIEEAWIKVGKALRDMDDDDRRAADGTKLLGRTYTETLPIIKDGLDKVSEEHTTMSSETTKSLSLAKSNWNVFTNYLKVEVGEAIADVLTGTTSKYREWLAAMKNLPPVANQLKDIYGGIVPPGLPKDLDAINAKFAEQEKALADARKAGDEFAKAQANLASVGKTWQDTLADINPWILQDIEASLKAGASMKDLATFYGLTEAQGRAVNAMIKDQTELMKEVAKVETDTRQKQQDGLLGLSRVEQQESQRRMKEEGDAAAFMERVYAEMRDAEKKAAMDSTTYQVMKLWEKADQEVQAHKLSADQAAVLYQQTQQAQDALYEHAAAKEKETSEQILFDVKAMADKLKGITDEAKQNITAATQQLQTLQGGVKMPGWSSEYVGGQNYLVNASTGQRIQIGPHGELPDNFESVISGNAFPSAITNQPRIGTGFGSAIGGGIYQFNITQPLGTPSAIASAVGDALMNQMRSQGIRTP